MKIEWLPEALRSLESQLAYIGGHDPAAAMNMGDAIEAAVAGLADFPESTKLGRVPGTRELIVTGTPFVIVYRLESKTVLILRMLHGAQQWPPK